MKRLLLVLLAGCSNTRNEETTGMFAAEDAAVLPARDALVLPPPEVIGLRINEVSSEAEYVELFNTGDPVRLEGWSLVDDGWDPANPAEHQAFLPDVSLAPGSRLLVSELPFGLGSDDALTLLDAYGRVVDTVDWLEGEAVVSLCRLPDGRVLQACRATPDAPNLGPEAVEPGRCGNGQVDAGEVCDGAAGVGDCTDLGFVGGTVTCASDCLSRVTSSCTRSQVPQIVINEVSSEDDYVELLNPGEVVELAGWSLVDDGWDPMDPATADNQYFLPDVSLAPGARLLLNDLPFGIGGDDAITLLDPQAQVVDTIDWLEDEALVALCRLPDGQMWQACRATPDAPNQGPDVAPGRCGDGEVGSGEVCDGPALGGMNCASLGFDEGSLSCAEDCRSLDTSACVLDARVLINEASSSDDDPIELYNAGRGPVSLDGWGIADSDYDPAMPEETADHIHGLSGVLAAGAFRVLIKGEDHPFGLGRADGLTLFDDAGAVADQTTWEEDQAEISWCRTPEGPFTVCEAASLGSENTP